MKGHESKLPEERPLSDAECGLVRWLLEHGTASAHNYLSQVPRLRVESRCRCGCASINFTQPFRPAGDVLSEYQWHDAAGHLNGIFVRASGGELAGLDLWSIDGASTPVGLSAPNQLRPLDEIT